MAEARRAGRWAAFRPPARRGVPAAEPVNGILVLYHRPLHHPDAATVREHIHSFARHSRYPVWEHNTAYGFPSGLERVRPAAVILHYSMFGSGNYLLGADVERWLEDLDAVTVAFFQDEFCFCRLRFGFVASKRIDHVYTHIDPRYWDETWHRFAPETTPHFNIPGYVAEDLVAAAERYARPDAERDIDVGYRGRALPPWMGAGGQEKRIIGDRFKELAADSGLRLDIATDEESRMYGDEWYRFLGRCRAVLGVESGTSFIDVDDEVYADYQRRLAAGEPVTLEAMHEGPLGRWDGKMTYRTLGPRHFEAAAFRNLQVMYEGSYSGALEPMVHYVPLAQDWSNLDEVLERIRDPEVRAELTENAHRDLIRSGRHTYAAFVAGVDETLASSGVGEPADAAAQLRLSEALAEGAPVRWVRAEARALKQRVMNLVYIVVAPISMKIRRRLGLRIPGEASA